MVHFQNGDGGPTLGSQADKSRAVPPEVIPPKAASRMEQPDYVTRFGIYPRKIRAFVVITSDTCQRQISFVSRPAILARYDMLDVEGVGA
jgi:hypothetical protein